MSVFASIAMMPITPMTKNTTGYFLRFTGGVSLPGSLCA